MFSFPKSPNFLNGLEIFKSIYEIKFFNKRIPLFCEWELTHFCNMSCPFCSTLSPDRNSTPDASPQEALNMIDQLAEMGTKMIHFSGGEPTLRNDLPDLVARAKQNKMMVSFTTNGSASIDKMEKLLDTDIFRISIDGTEDFHDSGRKFSGAFQKALGTLRFLVSKGKKPIITSVYKDGSSHQMLKDLALVARDLKAKISVNVVSNSHENSVEGNNCYLNFDYISAMQKLKAEFEDVFVDPEPFLSVIKLGGLNVYGCRAMDVAISIKADGSVCMPCTRFSKKKFDGGLKEIFYGKDAQELRLMQGKDSNCEGCAMRCMSSASGLLTLKGQVSTFNTYARSII